MKGLDTVYEAWQALEQSTGDIGLVLAGPVDKGLPPPSGPRVFYLGELSEDEVGSLFSALDVGIIPARNSNFGRYCFPQKLFEMLACGLPIAAARVGAICQLLVQTPELLFAPEDAEGLVVVISRQLDAPRMPLVKTEYWNDLVKVLAHALENSAAPP